MKTNLKLIISSVILLIFSGGFSACKEKENPPESNCEVPVTKSFYVLSASRGQCGYALSEHVPELMIHSHVWTENLPKEFRKEGLPVTVTFCYTGKKCGIFPIINIIKIEKQ